MDNIILCGDDLVIIDFGFVFVVGVDEIVIIFNWEIVLGMLDYFVFEY